MPLQYVWQFPFFVCTEADPWSPAKAPKGTLVSHPDADSRGGTDYGRGEYCEAYKCPHCGKSFEVELPQ